MKFMLWLKCVFSHFRFLLALSKRKRHQAHYIVNIDVKLENSTPGNMRRWEMTPSAPLWPVVAGAGRGPPGVQWMQWPATLQHSTISDRRPFKPAQSAQAAPSLRKGLSIYYVSSYNKAGSFRMLTNAYLGEQGFIQKLMSYGNPH